MEPSYEDDIDDIKERLKRYVRKDIIFNEPHFSEQIVRRYGDREEVIRNLLDPRNLAYSYSEIGSLGDTIHCLHFRISSTKTLRLPVIFDRRGGKNLYILTYIMRCRPWQNMIITRRRR
jgi:hypothetical protein